MGKPYPDRRRRRPRRRLRYRGGGFPARSRSFQDFGMRHIFDLLMPHIRGRDRRRLFNDVRAWLTLGFGVLGGLLGWGMAEPLGVILGFAAGVMLGANYLTRNRYFRP
jgi:hypothetical protein